MLTSLTLKKLQEEQKKLDEFIVQKNNITDSNSEESFIRTKIAFLVEIGELANELKTFKSWKKHKEVNWEKAKEELIDCLHFYLSFANTFQIDFKDYQFSPIFSDNNDSVIIPCDLSPVSITQYNNLILALFSTTEKMIVTNEKKTRPQENQKNFYHWLIIFEEVARRLGMNEKDIVEVYLAKNKINWERQKSSY